MTTIHLFAYRDWAMDAVSDLHRLIPSFDFTHHRDGTFYQNSSKRNCYCFFIGWSDIIPSDFVRSNYCYCIHPSDLPYYRGGSPIQNQIIDGITMSCITLFRMDQGIDSGPIVKKLPLSLAGFLPSILERISRFSFVLLYESLLSLQTTGKIPTYPQDSSLATTFKRRNPSQSILKINDLKNMSAIDLHNHVRCLQPPYPQLQIEFEDGTSLIIDKTSLA